jgi:DNA-binding CsgD family transcriptional regulator
LLSNGQLEVLRLVNRHLSSKEIGAELGISSHTVDQRIRGAIQRLQVSRRSEAARLVTAFDQAQLASGQQAPAGAAPYQRLIYQPPDIDAKPVEAQTDVAVGIQIRHADRTGGVGAERLETEQRSLSTRPFLFPVSTPQQPSNGWSVGRRLAAVGIIAVSASFSVGMFLAGLESLARLVKP